MKLAWPRSESPFDALLRAAEHDPEAAEGLALAYAGLTVDERGRLVESVLDDAAKSGRSPAAILALLLAVEQDERLARDVATALMAEGSRGLPRREGEPAWTWGGELEGGLAIARQRGEALEVTCVQWREGELAAQAQSASQDELAEILARVGVPSLAERIEARAAIDRLAEVLWRARRERGALPDALRSLADLFQLR